MFQALFWKKSRFAHFGQNCPKLAILAQNAQKWRFFAFFSESLHYFSLMQLIRAFNSKKMFQTLFWKKFPFCPFWQKTVQNWPFWPKMPKNGGFSHFYRNLFWLLGVPRTIYFGCLSLYFDNFFARKTVGSRETQRDGLLFFNFSF